MGQIMPCKVEQRLPHCDWTAKTYNTSATVQNSGDRSTGYSQTDPWQHRKTQTRNRPKTTVIIEPDSSQGRALELWKASNQIKPQATALSYGTHGITQQTKPSNPQKNNFRQEENCREKIG
ncbi:hypothetical protein ElyMa_005341700 [Elysia marginata]|uniref:Fibronectin type-III domain-containing protein n=1 Tax=Elysia marginata TaxID=1093978 RepID=A0AAV4EA64_9GAST|nr:hypothetical protein ElyMa_005341700 [Elysia marginata]